MMRETEDELLTKFLSEIEEFARQQHPRTPMGEALSEPRSRVGPTQLARICSRWGAGMEVSRRFSERLVFGADRASRHPSPEYRRIVSEEHDSPNHAVP